MGEFSKKLEEEWRVWKGIKQQAGTLKLAWDKSVGELILADRRFDKRDRLNECQRSANVEIFRAYRSGV